MTARRRPLLFAGLALLGIALCLALGPGSVPLRSDNEFQFFIAERAASGVPPYASFFTPKTAGSHLLTAVAIRAGRAAGVPDILAARALSIGIFAATAGLVGLLALELTGSLWLGALAGSSLLTFPGLVDHAVQGCRPKVFLVAFTLLLLWAVARRRPLLTGVAAALAVLSWQPAVLVAAPAALASLVDRRKGRAVARLLLGAALVVVPYELYFWSHGMLAEHLFHSVRVPLTLMPLAESSFSAPWPPIHWLARRAFGSWHPAAVAYVAAMAGGVLTVLVRPGATLRLLRRRPAWLAVGSAAAATAAFTLVEHQGPPDLFFVAPFVALAPAICLSAALRRAPGHVAGIVTSAVGALVLLIGLPQTWSYPPRQQLGYGLGGQIRLAERLDRRLGEGGSVYAHGALHLLAFRHRDNWSRWGLFYRGWRSVQAELPGGAEPLLERQGALPTIFLSDRRPVPREIRATLAARYRRMRWRDLRVQRIRGWVLERPVAGSTEPGSRRLGAQPDSATSKSTITGR